MTGEKIYNILYRAALGICIASLVILLAMPFIARKRSAPTNAPAKTASQATETPRTQLRPIKLWFYSHNWRTVGGYVTVKNVDGRILRGDFPTADEVHTELWAKNITETQNVLISVPPDYDFFRGYTVRFHAADGQVTRYLFDAIRADHDGWAAFYLHVCEGWDGGKFQGEPLKLRIQGPVGYETAPDSN